MRIARNVAIALAILGVAAVVRASDPPVAIPTGTLQVTTTLRAKGELKPSASSTPADKLPVEIDGRLEYAERPLRLAEADASSYRAIRHYQRADAKIKLPDGLQETTLSKTRRLIGVEVQPQRLNLYSPLGPITRDDLELISTQADPAAVAALVAGQELKAKGTWQPTDAAVGRVLGLDSIAKNEVQCTVESMLTNSVKIRVAGKVDGKCEGAKTKLQLSGLIEWDRKAHHARQIALTIDEQREPGQGTPGFTLKAEIRTDAKIVTTPKEVARETLGDMRLTSGEPDRLLDFAADTSGFRLWHDRRWRVVVHRADSVILRMINDGTLIGQCNVVSMPAMAAATPVELEKFRRGVETALEKHTSTIDEASRATSDAGIEILRIAASGKVEEVPVRWIYYHLSDKTGHRAALVFTIEEAHAKDFSDADHLLVGNFQFAAPQATASAGEQSPAQPPRTSTRPTTPSTQR